jgi:hypothetical protein
LFPAQLAPFLEAEEAEAEEVAEHEYAFASGHLVPALQYQLPVQAELRLLV